MGGSQGDVAITEMAREYFTAGDVMLTQWRMKVHLDSDLNINPDTKIMYPLCQTCMKNVQRKRFLRSQLSEWVKSFNNF